ncbi:hypothetical protein IM40_01050 [Candidatus Paracaedimonas acanthamoebae]|nr:hypothetical protein IM40_01050 [Candidatus Paracaedimonas acanthamoebae]
MRLIFKMVLPGAIGPLCCRPIESKALVLLWSNIDYGLLKKNDVQSLLLNALIPLKRLLNLGFQKGCDMALFRYTGA